jgi:hypothetical protein
VDIEDIYHRCGYSRIFTTVVDIRGYLPLLWILEDISLTDDIRPSKDIGDGIYRRPKASAPFTAKCG